MLRTGKSTKWTSTAFLQGNLEEEIYTVCNNRTGYVNEELPNYVCKLKKSIYELRQPARCWNDAIDNVFLKSGA
jgi:hypothetical protein